MRRKTDKVKETTSKSSTPRVPKVVKTPIELLQDIRLDLKPKNETQKELVHAIKLNDVTVCTGPAGTGKTLLSVFYALMLLKTHPELYKDIRLVKSIRQLRDEELGILPGDEHEKMKLQMMSFLDAFHKLIGEGLTNKLIELGLVRLEVFGSIRGRSLANTIIIVDEFQNISHDNAKTFLTRFAENTKIIVLGDSGQIDMKNKQDSSLEKLSNMIKKHPIDGVSVVEFSESEIVRHRLTSYFIGLFKPEDQPNKPKNNGYRKFSIPEPKQKLSLKEKFLNLFR